jgi:hypothetical protein
MTSFAPDKPVGTALDMKLLVCELRCLNRDIKDTSNVPLSIRLNAENLVEVVDTAGDLISTCHKDASEIVRKIMQRKDVRFEAKRYGKQYIQIDVYTEFSVMERLMINIDIDKNRHSKLGKRSYQVQKSTRYPQKLYNIKEEKRRKKEARSVGISDFAVDGYLSDSSDVSSSTDSLADIAQPNLQYPPPLVTPPPRKVPTLSDEPNPVYSIFNAPDASQISEYLGVIKFQVMGFPYEPDLASRGDTLTLWRDLSQKYDRYALYVVNTSQQIVGRVPSEVADFLSVPIDNDSIACIVKATSEPFARSQRFEMVVYRKATSQESVKELLSALTNMQEFRKSRPSKPKYTAEPISPALQAFLEKCESDNDIILGSFICEMIPTAYEPVTNTAYILALEVERHTWHAETIMKDMEGNEVAEVFFDNREGAKTLLKDDITVCLGTPVTVTSKGLRKIKVLALAKQKTLLEHPGIKNFLESLEAFRPLMFQATANAIAQELNLIETTFVSYEMTRVSPGTGGRIVAETYVKTMDWEKQQKELDAMFDQAHKDQMADVPEYELSPLLKNVNLYDYQIAGIRWLMHQERCAKLPPYFKQQADESWYCEITQSVLTEHPKSVVGRILADDMGLGKVS